MTEDSLFVLVPPLTYTQSMPNLGDRALHEGLNRLLQASHQGQFVYDEWNSFPRLTWPRLAAKGMLPATRFVQWHKQYLQQIDKPVPMQQAFSDLLFGPVFAWLPIWPVLDKIAYKRTGQTGREAVAPRLFPRLAAQRFASRLASADALIMNAGGLLADHLAHYLPGRIFALQAAQQAGRRTALVNYSFAVTRPELMEWVMPVMRAVDVHAVRESHSKESLLSIGIEPSRIIVTPDAAFAIDAPTVPARLDKKPIIAVQLRGDRSPDLAAWAELIGALQARCNARIVFLIGCHKYDPPLLAKLKKRVALDVDDRGNSLMALKNAIGAVDILITDRYHGIVFATQMGITFVPLAGTTLKTAGLVNDLDYPGVVYSPLTKAGIEGVLSDVVSLLADRDKVSRELVSRALAFKSRLFDEYQTIIGRLLSEAGENSTKSG